MTNFMNADGSGLVGGLNPSNVGQALQVDGGGNLKVSTSVGGSSAAPLITQDQLRAWLSNGQSFIGTTGQMNSATGTNNNPLCIFNPASSGKSILIYSLSLSSGTAASNSISAIMQYVTVNPAYGSTATVSNAKAGGPASAIAATCTFTTTNQTLAGAFVQFMVNAAPIELLSNGRAILLPNGSANGLTVFLQTYASGISNITARWIEF